MGYMLVYLAGPMTEDCDWRVAAEDFLRGCGIDSVKPELKAVYKDRFAVSEDEACRILTERDMKFATESDILLANFGGTEKPSMGTCVELGWASAAGTTIVSVIPYGTTHDHPILTSASDYVVDTLIEALRIIAALGWENSEL